MANPKAHIKTILVMLGFAVGAFSKISQIIIFPFSLSPQNAEFMLVMVLEFIWSTIYFREGTLFRWRAFAFALLHQLRVQTFLCFSSSSSSSIGISIGVASVYYRIPVMSYIRFIVCNRYQL